MLFSSSTYVVLWAAPHPDLASAKERKAPTSPILGKHVCELVLFFFFSAMWDTSRILNAGAVSGSLHTKIASSSQGREHRESLFQSTAHYCPFHLHHSCGITSYIRPLLYLPHTSLNQIFDVVTFRVEWLLISVGLYKAAYICSTSRTISGSICREERNQ